MGSRVLLRDGKISIDRWEHRWKNITKQWDIDGYGLYLVT